MTRVLAALVVAVGVFVASGSTQDVASQDLIYKDRRVTLTPSTAFLAYRTDGRPLEDRITAAIQAGAIQNADVSADTLVRYNTILIAVNPAMVEASSAALRGISGDAPFQAVPVYRLGSADVVPTPEVIVGFNRNTNDARIAAVLNGVGISTRLRAGAVPGSIIVSAGARSPIEVSNALNRIADVEYAEPNFISILPASLAASARQTPPAPSAPAPFPSDLYFRYQWNLENALPNIKSGGDIKIQPVWATVAKKSLDPTRITVAVLDEGVDSTHEDLKGTLVNPYDAITGSQSQTPNAWDYHGTASAGIIGALTNNKVGVAGIGFGLRIMPVRVGSTGRPVAPGQRRWVNSFDIAALGIIKATDTGADVLSNSWVGGTTPLSVQVERAIAYATTSGRGGKGAVVVFSAGNSNGPVEWPATLSKTLPLITVAATNQWDELKTLQSQDRENWGSNTGPEISVAAPGVHIMTTDITGPAGAGPGHYIQTFNGTSSSAPHVAAVAALLLAKCPGLTAGQVRDRITKWADRTVILPDGKKAAFGRLNAAATLAPPCASSPSPSPVR